MDTISEVSVYFDTSETISILSKENMPPATNWFKVFIVIILIIFLIVLIIFGMYMLILDLLPRTNFPHV